MPNFIITLLANTIPSSLLIITFAARSANIYYALAAIVATPITSIISSKWGLGDDYTTLLQFVMWGFGWVITPWAFGEYNYHI